MTILIDYKMTSIQAGVQIKPYFAGDTVFSPRGESKKFKAKKAKKSVA